MIDASAIQEIAKLAREAAGHIVTIDGRSYSTTQLHDPRAELHEPAPFCLATLTALVEYIKCGLDKETEGCVLQVVAPDQVGLFSRLRGEFRQRFTYAVASCWQSDFLYGEWLDLEAMNIALQTQFVDDYDRPDLLRLVGNVKSEVVKTAADDGVTQRVTARAGVATVEDVKVPNPVELAPYRTFPEVDQPASWFVFRLAGREGIAAALFEADGGAWRNAAMRSVADWLKKELPAWTVLA